MNEIVEQEILALESIYGKDLTRDTIVTKDAWKAPRTEQTYTLRLGARTDKLRDQVVVHLYFQFPKE